MSTSNRLTVRSTLKKERPVTLPSGRLRFATSPAAVMSPVTVTIGTSVVAFRAAIAAVAPIATIACGWRATASVARAANATACASAERWSMVMVAPGICPNVRRPSSRARTTSGGDDKLSTTMRGGLARCCATAARGASSVRVPSNTRREINRSCDPPALTSSLDDILR
jgi:hypothetical protein